MINVTFNGSFVYIWKDHKLVKAIPTTWRDPYKLSQEVKKKLSVRLVK